MKSTEELKKLRVMSGDELTKELVALEKKLSIERLNVLASKSENYSEIGKLKKNAARIATVIREKELSNE